MSAESEFFAVLAVETFGKNNADDAWEKAMGQYNEIKFDCLRNAMESYEKHCG